ncbi:hypothetical protein DDN98_10520 [Vibrio cholerae]|uniref:hypothetical protein n=1 Tax=Vibrio cholerae TaxID=666 RepID=UPI001DDF4BAB|nr:hypothetical protein [Vibrio cholerae]EGR4298026.1 hypothetical protein [Vibrio cholerae]
MKNSDMPAMPVEGEFWIDPTNTKLGTENYHGLTKREMFCLHLGVPETGDPELDEIIKKGNRMKIAANFGAAYLNGQISWTNGVDGGVTPNWREVSDVAVDFSDDLIEFIEMTKTKNPA